MTNEEIINRVKSILLQHFDVETEQFDLKQPLEVLQKDFKILDSLVLLEQLLQKEFNKDISLLEHISTAFHTPQDIVDLIQKEN